MPLPTLTWSRTVETTAASSNAADLLTAIATAIGNASGWEVKSSDTEYVEFGPTGGPIANFRGLLVGQNSGAPASASMANPHSTGLTNALHLGVAPDGMGTFAGTWDVADPTGGQRWSQYLRTCGAGLTDKVYCISSAEVLAVIMVNAGVSTFAFVCGAYVSPPTDADGEGTPGRLFGMMVSGSNQIHDDFWYFDSAFTSSNTTQSSPVTGVFRPDDPGNFVILKRIQGTDIDDQDNGYLTTAGGTRVHLPVNYRMQYDPYAYIGELRQMRMAQDAAGRVEVQDGTPTTQSFVMGADDTIVRDALAFDQG